MKPALLINGLRFFVSVLLLSAVIAKLLLSADTTAEKPPSAEQVKSAIQQELIKRISWKFDKLVEEEYRQRIKRSYDDAAYWRMTSALGFKSVDVEILEIGAQQKSLVFGPGRTLLNWRVKFRATIKYIYPPQKSEIVDVREWECAVWRSAGKLESNAGNFVMSDEWRPQHRF